MRLRFLKSAIFRCDGRARARHPRRENRSCQRPGGETSCATSVAFPENLGIPRSQNTVGIPTRRTPGSLQPVRLADATFLQAKSGFYRLRSSESQDLVAGTNVM